METVTAELIDTHLMSFIEIYSAEQRDGVTRYAWNLSPMANAEFRRECEPHEFSYEYESHASARRYAFGWIRRNRPDLREAARHEAIDGIRYRAKMAALEVV